MAWEEKLSVGLKIITGDQREWSPLSMLTSNKYSFGYNVSEFEFPEVTGTKVDRRLPKGRRFPLEFFFQGSDNLEVSEDFRISSNDKRPWTVIHPAYGQINGHPLSLEVDNSGINVTKITCEFVESITDEGPKTTEDLRATTAQTAVTVQDLNNEYFIANVTPEITDVTLMESNVDAVYEAGKGSISDNDIAAQYFNLRTTASSKINSALADTTVGISFVQDFLAFPADFILSVKQRIDLLKTQALKLSAILDTLTTPNEKIIFENNKTSIITAVIQSTVTPIGNDYENATDVLFVIDEVLEIYNLFITELNSLQTENGTEPESYLPDYQVQFNLNYSVNFAVANLFQIALNAQQERIVYLESDSNVIIQTHRFYGLEQDDSTLQRFIDTNNIGLKEVLQLKKGRKLVYYV